MLRKHLPPLKSLVYFETAARLVSFTRAAAELNVTQGAVSRQVRQLEQFLGLALFRRAERQVFLNAEGNAYYLTVRHLLDQLEVVTASIQSSSKPDEVTVVTSSALASLYLLPKVPAFRRRHPDIQIRIVARDTVAELTSADYDMALYFMTVTPDDDRSLRLFDEEVFPVCSPGYQEENADQFIDLRGLSTNLIWLETEEDWINWPQWFEGMEIDIQGFGNRLVVNHYPMVVQAAVSGQGIALGWGHLIDQHLARGELVRPVEVSLLTGAGFYLIRPAGRQISETAGVVHSWLSEQSMPLSGLDPATDGS